MKPNIKSIRPFVGAKDYDTSREFYTKIGCTETVISKDMSLFSMGDFAFYLQDYYVRKWIDNTMLFLEVKNLEEYLLFLEEQEITKLKGVKLSKIHKKDWGQEFFLHDPSGVLWHIGNFD